VLGLHAGLCAVPAAVLLQPPRFCSPAPPPSGHSAAARALPALRDFLLLFPPQKRSQPLEFIDPLANKKPRISHLAHRAQPTFNGKLNANGKDVPIPVPSAALPPALPESVSSSSSSLPELPRPHDPLADVSNDLSHNGRDCEGTEPADRLSLPAPTDCAQTSKHNCGSYVKSKKKSKKHKDKEKERKEKKSEEKCKEEKQDCEVIKNADLVSEPQDAPGTCPAALCAGCRFCPSPICGRRLLCHFTCRHCMLVESQQRPCLQISSAVPLQRGCRVFPVQPLVLLGPTSDRVVFLLAE